MRRAPLVPVALVLMACLALGRPLLHRFDRGHWTHNCPEKTFITLRLTESPQPRAKSYRAFAQVTAINDQPRHGDITVYLRKDSIAGTLCYGDHLLLHGYPDTVKRSLYHFRPLPHYPPRQYLIPRPSREVTHATASPHAKRAS